MNAELRTDLFDRLCEIESKVKFNDWCLILNDMQLTHVKWDNHFETVLPEKRTIDDVVEPIKEYLLR